MAKRSKSKHLDVTREPSAKNKRDGVQAQLEELVRKTLALRDQFRATHAVGMDAIREHDPDQAAAEIERERELIREQTRLAAEFLRVLKSIR